MTSTRPAMMRFPLEPQDAIRGVPLDGPEASVSRRRPLMVAPSRQTARVGDVALALAAPADPPLRSSLPALGFFHPASCPARSPWAPCLTPACPGPEGTAGCSPASVRPRCPEGADPPIGDIKGKQEAAAPPTPRGREECVSQRGRGPGCWGFSISSISAGHPCPGLRSDEPLERGGGSRAIPGPAGSVLSLPATCWRVRTLCPGHWPHSDGWGDRATE